MYFFLKKQYTSKHDLLLTPISNKRYIRNEEHGIFVILECHNVKVINHVYSYTVFLEKKKVVDILHVVDLKHWIKDIQNVVLLVWHQK